MSGETLLALETDALTERFAALGGKPFHARITREQVLGGGVLDYAAMTALPALLRERLAAELPLLASTETGRSTARDGTVKLLLSFRRGKPSGDVSIETVWMPARPKAPVAGATLCVSTQAGCPIACPFCASGLAGLERNLEAHEIIEQFVRARQLGPISRAVVMGIGEPLLNYANLTRALRVVREELGIGARRITVSTVGFPDRLHRAAREEPGFQLAISLHTPFDEERDELVPAMKGVPVDEVLAAGDDWFDVTGREVTYEIALLARANDTPEHADALVQRLRGRRCTVNLIPYNPSPGLPYERPEPGTPEAFAERLRAGGLVATVRWSRGVDGAAACGQLRLQARR